MIIEKSVIRNPWPVFREMHLIAVASVSLLGLVLALLPAWWLPQTPRGKLLRRAWNSAT
jgi:hypothetical protein